jgi:DNA polymerase-3 subunit epsilon
VTRGKHTATRDPVLAIVDTETTHANPAYGRVIEVAVLRVERGKVVRTFHTLVNPDRPVQPDVERVTGISAAALTSAPFFGEIAKELWDILEGALFVAHNAKFDYAFLRHEFQRVRRAYSARCVDTVALSKRLYPEFLHHDLTSLIARYELPCPHRHRALDDASALWAFLRHAEATTGATAFSRAFNGVAGNGVPVHLAKEDMQALPEDPGVYLLYGGQGELLYVGKSTNIRRRVQSHFHMAGADTRELQLFQQTHHVDARPTSGELGALLLESRLIKELRPVYNRASRRTQTLIVLLQGEAPGGYAEVRWEPREQVRAEEIPSILTICKHRQQAREFLVTAAREFVLCHKLLGLERTKESCFQYQLHRCHGACIGREEASAYNRRFEEAFRQRRIKTWPYRGSILITEPNASGNGGESFLVDHWCLVLSVRHSDEGFQEIIPGLERFDFDTYKLLYRFLHQPCNRGKVKLLTDAERSRLLVQAQPG